MVISTARVRGFSAAVIVTLGLCTLQPAVAADASSVEAAASPVSQADQTSKVVSQASNPFADVPANHWAYDAVRQLAADGYIQGYPDGQYKGQRPMTRYEAAVLTDRAVRSIEAKLAQLQQVEQRDIAAVRALINAFRPELDQIKSQIAALQRKAADQDKSLADLKKEANATQLRVNQGKLGFQLIYKPGTAFTNVSVTNGSPGTITFGGIGTPAGQAIPGGIGGTTANNNGNTFAFGPGATNATPLGPFQHGINYFLARFLLGGQLDPRWSYGLRVSAKLTQETPFGATTVGPSLCPNTTTTNCSFSDLNNGQGTIPLNLDYAFLQYNSPGGIVSKIGRFGDGSYGKYAHAPQGILVQGGILSGLEVGYNDPAGRVFGELYYAIPSVSSYTLAQAQGTTTQNVCTQNVVGLNLGSNQTQYSQVNPNCNTTQSQVAAWGEYYFPYSRTAVGGTYDTYFGKQFTFWDASAVNCNYAGTVRMAVNQGACAANSTLALPAGTSIGTGNYFTAQGNPSAIEAYVSQYFGPFDLPMWNFQMTWDRHLGSDPINGGAWNGANAYSASLTYASKGNVFNAPLNPFSGGAGRAHSNVVELMYYYYGLNSLGGIETPYNNSPDFTNNTGFANWNGTQMYGIEFGHWLTDNVRVSLGALHLQSIPGVFIPVSTGVGGNNACSGCFVNAIDQNQVNAEMYLYFF